ncbi:cystathionine beta-lyase [Bordetella hinzii 1277]|uniref:cystathionine beta-lyase n=1 Tax=Bordetella hinzii TaxID=103855 RepID=UPI00045A2D9E|nr:cystathionine beta-lyase [Bordetella hinzii]KCB46761.1 cystathionine beta-lyase [Bordetella hinzii 1277]WPL83363.1 cystathionine beta-lyase [Bordetella hinzii]
MPKDLSKDPSAFATRLLRAGRPHQGWVNTPVTRASTYVFDSVGQWRDTRQRRGQERLPSYGARGTDSTYALEDALVLLEGGYRAKVFPTGLAAIAVVMLAYLKAGDHVLITDGVYEPARALCAQSLARLGISHDFYQPDGSDLADKMRPNTRMIYAENPSSLVYEMMDLRAVSALAKRHGCLLAVDNTWGSGLLHQPLALGADISIIAATKYLSGHADVMMGTVVTTREAWPELETAQVNYGQTVGADDAYLMLRGLRTLPVRMRAHQENMLEVAGWLKRHPAVARVYCAAYAEGAQREIFERDFRGSNGLVSVEFAAPADNARMEAMIDALDLFGIGASWGGYESLVVPMNMVSARSLSSWSGRGPMCRFHIGLEDPADLIADLDRAFGAHLS